MNIQGNINKLLLAIKMKGEEISIRTSTYYSQNTKKYITKIVVYAKTEYVTKKRSNKRKMGRNR